MKREPRQLSGLDDLPSTLTPHTSHLTPAIAEVVFNLPIDRAFHYSIPTDWQTIPQPGMRVLAHFAHRHLVGTVIRLRRSTWVKQPKALLRLIEAEPVLTREALGLARWLAAYYGCSVGEACASIVPTSLAIRPSASCEKSPGGETEKPMLRPTAHFEALSPQQQRAFSRIASCLRASRHQVFLLHDIAGSERAELYVRLIDQTLRQGCCAVFMVPEISLISRAIEDLRERFGSEVALWHSQLTQRQRSEQWQRIAKGHSRIVVGTRSAVFAPVKPLGMMILDEERDPSYKQEESPRYHARDVAIVRARLADAVVVLGGAAPSVESYYHARMGRLCLVELKDPARTAEPPKVEVIDMREELRGRRWSSPFSERLKLGLRHVVEAKDRAILLLDRRGFARAAQCPACGFAMHCPHCAVPLVYHASARQMACHYCNANQKLPDMCPTCQRGYLRLQGYGTERIESELHRLFPALSIARVDADTAKAKRIRLQLSDSIKAGQIDLLVGTQMVAKGFDIPQVGLVGVVSADTALHLPDFRSGERTFVLLTRLADRAGGADRPGRMIIQTRCPSHYAIQAASRNDYRGFYRAEIRMRRRLGLPPFVHLIELTIQGASRQVVEQAAGSLSQTLQSKLRRQRVEILGPAPHRIARLRQAFRWRLILKSNSVPEALRVIRRVLGETRRFQGLPVIVDVDPL